MNSQIAFNGILNEFTEITRTKFQLRAANEYTINHIIISQPVAERPQRLLSEKLKT